MSKEAAPKKAPPTTTQYEPKASAPVKGKAHTPMPDGCHSWGCKAKSHLFNFCDEHYDHFKFGLIKKSGEPVSDYEKKFEHYLAYTKKRSAQKVA
ncbi:hypothetical protein WDW37_19830 [Bdellovibrionota bacterium FG-1]